MPIKSNAEDSIAKKKKRKKERKKKKLDN